MRVPQKLTSSPPTTKLFYHHLQQRQQTLLFIVTTIILSFRLFLVVVEAAATTTEPPYSAATNTSKTIVGSRDQSAAASISEVSSRLPIGSQEQQISEQYSLGGNCAIKSTCKLRSRRLELDGGSDKRPCYCDNRCVQYDDCCSDSARSSSFKQRIDMGLEQVRRARQQWHCHRVNPIFGDILVRASCSHEWLVGQRDQALAEQVRRRCEYVKDRGKRKQVADYQTDPVGMMMPITDLVSGVTYANSYCLRCNRLQQQPNASNNNNNNNKNLQQHSNKKQQQQQQQQQPPKLIYWSPLLTCNYNLETDERNTLYDLISANKGQVLKYSSKRNKWIIDTGSLNNNNNNDTTRAHHNHHNRNQTDDDARGNDRVCSIAPTIPDSVENFIRYCRSNTIDSCPKQLNKQMDVDETIEYQSWKLECEFGHQALVYSQTSDAIYYNLACAKCNHEKEVFCEPKLRKYLTSTSGLSKFTTTSSQQQTGGSANESTQILSSSPSDPDAADADDEEPDGAGEGRQDDEMGGSPWDEPINKEVARGRGEAHSGTAFSGSFSILIDLYGSSQGDEQVGAIHQCPDMNNQVYDPFHNVCRDIVCGLNQQQSVDGKCVDVKEAAQLRVDVVDKFKPPMAYLTTVCLTISIASLSMYLALYCLSMCDLRHLVVDMAQASADRAAAAAGGVGRDSPLDKHRPSKCSSTGSCSGGSKRSQSLSSRGVACLAASLLIAYLFFILGHQPSLSATDQQTSNSTTTSGQPEVTITCLSLALGTYYCFLVAFNWMFLLSYDIWRTLKLATCQLRGPAMHSQSRRFISYMLLSLIASGLIVCAAILVDLVPLECGGHHHVDMIAPAATNDTTMTANCSKFEWEISKFMQMYRPKFGQRAGSCWFSNRRALALFFGLPIAIIMFLNLLFFLHSSCMVIRTSSRSSRHLSSTGSAISAGSGSGVAAAYAKQSDGCPRLISVISNVDSSIGGLSSDASTDTSTDYIHQNSLTTNSMISVQTLQSHMSASGGGGGGGCSSDESSAGGDSPAPAAARCRQPPEEGAPRHQFKQQPSGNTTTQAASTESAGMGSPTRGADLERKRRQLVASQSSCSLGNQSIGASSIAMSLGLKCDLHHLGSMMDSVVKDYRLYCRLSTIMGLTWLTGLMASVVDQSDALWYVFVVLNTLQGLFIFIGFGCKRSKLGNLEILLSYLQFRWLNFWNNFRIPAGQKSAAGDAGEKKHDTSSKIKSSEGKSLHESQ